MTAVASLQRHMPVPRWLGTSPRAAEGDEMSGSPQDLLQVHDLAWKEVGVVRPTTSVAAVTSATTQRTC